MNKNNSSYKEWKLVNFCEFDKYAVTSYCAVHGVDPSLNLGDITKVDETQLEDFDLMTWGFPCTDISVAGKQVGFADEDGNKTRSGLYYDGIRILREKKPKISIIENVKNLTSKRFQKEFQQVLFDLEDAGYNTYWKILNTKDYGIPQNRERVFIVSIRKDVDNGKFQFPKGFDNGLRLRDMLEEEVEEKYYINTPRAKELIEELKESGKLEKEFSKAVRTSGGGQCRPPRMGYGSSIGYIENGTGKHQSNMVYDSKGIARTIDASDYKHSQKTVIE